VKVVILCGGRGTRIREISDVIPKPMIPIGNRPILWHIMKTYSAYGFHNFVLLLGYKGQVIRDYILNFAAYNADVTVDLTKSGPDRLEFHGQSQEPWRVTLLDTGENAMTGARIYRARPYLDRDALFCATYGDGVGDVNIYELIKFHQSHGRVATLTGVHPPGRFGELNIEGTRVRAFNEKPQVSGGHINGGFFVFNAEIFDRYLSDSEDLVLEREPFEQMTRDGQLMVYQHEGFWQPMDTPREFEILNQLWQSDQPPWKVWS
jgi:glucose-1-phosphate cytidylyltransferase